MNNVNNVSAGKPKITGSIFSAPLGTPLPTNATDELDGAFVHHGYGSEDGITNSNGPETEKIKAWGGDVVLVVQNGKEDTFKVKLIESLNINNLKVVYGENNVSGNLAEGIVVCANAEEKEGRSWVIDMILRGAVKRVVIPEATISEMSEIKYADKEAIGYEITLSAVPDASGNTHYEYIKSATITEAAKLTNLTLGSLALNPAFDPDVTEYEAETTNATNSITATAAEGTGILISVNGASLTNGSSATWATGENIVHITVSAEGKSTTGYVVVVNKSE